MPRVPRTVEDAATALDAATTFIPDRYRAGVERAEFVKYAASDQAETNFAASMQVVIAQKLRQQGIRQAGDEAWKAGVIEKGVNVIAQRIRANLNKYREHFGRAYGPVLRLLPRLPAKTLDIRQNVMNRALPVAEEFHRHRVRRRARG